MAADCSVLSNLQLLQFISDNEVGKDAVLRGPFGARRVTYADYTASGRALHFLEEYVAERVLPWYGNTHTVTAATSRQMTLMREEARNVVRNAVRASEHDCVVFTGSGTTAAVNLLVHAMGLRPSEVSRNPPIVFHGPFEHHSNLLPWRTIGAKIVAIPESVKGQLDLEQLEAALKEHLGCGCLLIGAFSAASNLTGVLTDTDAVTSLLHRYGALAFWDYATAAPHVDINMNPLPRDQDPAMVAKDAVYFSPHKFIGGVDSPGVLVAKKRLFQNSTPYTVGGGTVFFVSPSAQLYLREVESREEGGTPGIVGSIRVGLAMQLKQAVGVGTIAQREEKLTRHVQASWGKVPELILLGPENVPKLPVFSFVVRHPPSGRLLHHNYVCALLNDLFGIQARGGCSCAGPYAQSLLGISPNLADRFKELLVEDPRLDRAHLRRQGEYSERELLRPGVSRLSCAYFMSDEVVEYIIKAVTMVAKHGWKLLPLYDVDPNTGLFSHSRSHTFADRQWLGSITYKQGRFHCPAPTQHGPAPTQHGTAPTQHGTAPTQHGTAPSFEECLEEAEELFDLATHCHGDVTRSLGDQSVLLGNSAEPYRWFLYPQEAQSWLRGTATAPPTAPPFTPKSYNPPLACCSVWNSAVQPGSKQTSDQVQERKQTSDQVQERKQTSDQVQERKQTSDQVQERKQTSDQVEERKQTSDQVEERKRMSDQVQERKQTSDQVEERKQTFDQVQERKQTFDQVQERKQTSDQVQERKQTFDQVQERKQTSDQVEESVPVLVRDGCSPEMYHNRTQSQQYVAMATANASVCFHCPPKCILKPTMEAIEEYGMIRHGDRVLVCLSGGKDSLSLLHTLHQYRFIAQAKGTVFTFGAVTVDPGTASYDPSPLIPYLQGLGVTYFYEEQKILEKAREVGCSSICAFCSRMKRGRLYACARREGYNVLAMGQHLDDLAESFLMAAFHNGFLRTMKAHYTVQDGDLRVIRPFVYVREKDLRVFAEGNHLPVIPENCPACFEAPKERHRMKQLLAAQELVFPRLFASLQAAMKPLMSRSTTGLESNRACQDNSGPLLSSGLNWTEPGEGSD